MKQWRAVLPHRRGCRWGVTGMLLAVPITAVLRIHLSHIYHPLPRWIAALLVGSAAVGAVAARVADCLLYTSPSPRDLSTSRMPSSA